MNDDDLEKTLRRYRVVEPPAFLASRITTAPQSQGPGHVWGALAAAAIAAIWVAAHATMRDSVPDPVRERDVSAVTEALGGGEEMRQYAEEIVPRRQTTFAAEWPVETSW
jgi:hypothetical protein